MATRGTGPLIPLSPAPGRGPTPPGTRLRPTGEQVVGDQSSNRQGGADELDLARLVVTRDLDDERRYRYEVSEQCGVLRADRGHRAVPAHDRHHRSDDRDVEDLPADVRVGRKGRFRLEPGRRGDDGRSSDGEPAERCGERRVAQRREVRELGRPECVQDETEDATEDERIAVPDRAVDDRSRIAAADHERDASECDPEGQHGRSPRPHAGPLPQHKRGQQRRERDDERRTLRPCVFEARETEQVEAGKAESAQPPQPPRPSPEAQR